MVTHSLFFKLYPNNVLSNSSSNRHSCFYIFLKIKKLRQKLYNWGNLSYRNRKLTKTPQRFVATWNWVRHSHYIDIGYVTTFGHISLVCMIRSPRWGVKKERKYYKFHSPCHPCFLTIPIVEHTKIDEVKRTKILVRWDYFCRNTVLLESK